MIGSHRIIIGDCMEGMKSLPDGSVHCCITSPPYWGLRDYGCDGQIGLEATPDEFIARMVAVFRELRRVLRDDGTLWLNLGDSYSNDTKWGGTSGGKNYTSAAGGYQGQRVRRGKDCDPKRGIAAPGQPMEVCRAPGLKPKDLCGIPWRVALALQADGWWLRQDIIWAKPNPMPESVTDRCTKAHEYVFLLSKAERYYYDAEAVKEAASENTHSRGSGTSPKNELEAELTGRHKGWGESTLAVLPFRNRRSVWTVPTAPYSEAHFATYPPKLIEPMILAGTSAKGCCAKCGNPWERVVEKERTFESGSGRSGNMPVGKNGAALQGGGETLDIRRGPVVHATTTGWQPTCACNAEIAPCTVFDPFGGSGTTAAVANLHGRNAILCELNPQYATLAERRIGLAVRPDTYRDESKPDAAPLFALSGPSANSAPLRETGLSA